MIKGKGKSISWISEGLADMVIDAIDNNLPEYVTGFDGTNTLPKGRFTRLERMLEPLKINVFTSDDEPDILPLQEHWHCTKCGVSLSTVTFRHKGQIVCVNCYRPTKLSDLGL